MELSLQSILLPLLSEESYIRVVFRKLQWILYPTLYITEESKSFWSVVRAECVCVCVCFKCNHFWYELKLRRDSVEDYGIVSEGKFYL